MLSLSSKTWASSLTRTHNTREMEPSEAACAHQGIWAYGQGRACQPSFVWRALGSISPSKSLQEGTWGSLTCILGAPPRVHMVQVSPYKGSRVRNGPSGPRWSIGDGIEHRYQVGLDSLTQDLGTPLPRLGRVPRAGCAAASFEAWLPPGGAVASLCLA